MTIDEIEDKSLDLYADIKNNRVGWQGISNLSIEFATSVLEDTLGNIQGPLINCKYGLDKIQEFKTYLDEEI